MNVSNIRSDVVDSTRRSSRYLRLKYPRMDMLTLPLERGKIRKWVLPSKGKSSVGFELGDTEALSEEIRTL